VRFLAECYNTDQIPLVRLNQHIQQCQSTAGWSEINKLNYKQNAQLWQKKQLFSYGNYGSTAMP